jgi:hypothetical protein
MRRSLSQVNKSAVVAISLLALTGCGASAENGDGTTNEDSVSVEQVVEAPVGQAADSPLKAPPLGDTIAQTPEQQKEGKAISHSSENDRLRDSIKKAKAKDKVQTNREVRHGSDNDQLLDSIKQAKAKGKK